MNTTFNITAIGVLAGELQTPVQQIAQAAELLGIEPTARINNVPHFSATDVQRIAESLRSMGSGTTDARASIQS